MFSLYHTHRRHKVVEGSNLQPHHGVLPATSGVLVVGAPSSLLVYDELSWQCCHSWQCCYSWAMTTVSTRKSFRYIYQECLPYWLGVSILFTPWPHVGKSSLYHSNKYVIKSWALVLEITNSKPFKNGYFNELI